MPKNIIVLSDGTGQEGGRGHDSNIYKMFRMLEDRTPNQVVFYDQGLGTDWRKFSGSVFGAGFSNNILQCYHFIYDQYEAGDKIFLFGFSRGAATVRSLANFIHFFGILPKARPELIRQAWQIYRRGRQEVVEADQQGSNMLSSLLHRTASGIDAAFRDPLNERAKDFVREHPNQWVSIDFLGVWDTVPALGLVPLAGLNPLINHVPFWRHRFHDFKLHESVRNAYHVLSIDDDRLWFHPTVWKKSNPDQTVEQVWFSGSHTDVGGGFMAAGLSDISLEWMVEKAVGHGMRLYLGSRRFWNFAIAPDGTDRWHPPRVGITKGYAFGLRNTVWDEMAFDSFGPPRLHSSVLERALNDANYRPWALTEYGNWVRRLPGKFDAYLQEQHEEAYDRAFEAYYEHMMDETAGGPAPELPGSLEDWLQANPYASWLAEHHGPYAEQKENGVTGEQLLAWLEDYPPFQEWLAVVYPGYTKTELGRFIVEDTGRIYEYRDAEGRWSYTNREYSSAELDEKGWTEFGQVVFRDYDRDRLKELKASGLDNSPRGAFDNLLERVRLKKPIVEQQPDDPAKRKPKNVLHRWESRLDYDWERWSGDSRSEDP